MCHGRALGEELEATSSFSGDCFNWCRSVMPKDFVRLRLPGEQEEYFGPRFHCKMFGKPDAVCQRHLLQFEVCTRLDLGEKTSN